jgi:DNA adenine methylase
MRHRKTYNDPDTRIGYYNQVRKNWNDGVWKRGTPDAAAAFIFLNKTCFNGLWRVNQKGQFNTPEGDYRNPSIFDVDAIKAASKLLAKTAMLYGSFEETTKDAGEGDFVYFDPPYDPISKTSNFTGYTRGGFGDDMQEKLAKHAQALHERGAKVMLSNNNTEMIRHLYAGFHFSTVQCARSINSKGDKRGPVDEVIITSWRI